MAAEDSGHHRIYIMNTSFVVINDNPHLIRDRYILKLYGDLKNDGDELLIINVLKDYRNLGDISSKREIDVRTIDIFHVTDLMQPYFMALEKLRNDLVYFLTPDMVMSKKSFDKLKPEVISGDYSGSLYGNGLVINPENGSYYHTEYSYNIMLNSLLFRRDRIKIADLIHGNFKLSVFHKLNEAGQILVKKNENDFIELLPYLSEPAAKVGKALGNVSKDDSKATKAALSVIRGMWIS